MCLRGGVKLVDGDHSFQDGFALSDAFRDVMGSQSDFTGDICGVADCTTEMEIAWESDGETMVVLCRTGIAESGGLLLGAVQGIRLASCAGGAAINYAWPIVLLILLALFAGQPIPKKKYIGMFISLGGVVLISVGTGSRVAWIYLFMGCCWQH